jgi:hypothetical protein
VTFAGLPILHASGPCQNHLGFTLVAAAIVRLTSPGTASLSPVT